MPFRILNQSPVYLDNAGVPLAGGSLTFTDTGTTTPRTVWNNKALSTPLTNPVVLDSAGRAPSDIWGSGSYRVVLKNSVGTVIKTLDDVDELSNNIPSQASQSGKFLTTNGSVMSWATISQLPSQTGQASKYLRTDGTTASWANPATTPVVNTVVSATTLTPDAGFDQYNVTALASPLTIANPTGTWADGQGCVIRLKDDGTARAISFGANYQSVGITLPTTTVATKIMYLGFIYNLAAAKFDVTVLRRQA